MSGSDTGGSGRPGDVAIGVRGLGREFDGRPVLDGIDLDVATGEFISVVGPSGCGKTTLLGLLAGLLAPTTGTIEVTAGPLAYVFQEPALMPWRTVAGNVGVLAEVAGVPATERQRRVSDALTLVGLDHVADALPHTLSGGMQMRTSLARALATDPAVLLADEPFGALDEITRIRLDVELAHLARRRQLTTVMVTHSVDEAVLVADRVVVLGGNPGRHIATIEVPLGPQRDARTRFDPHAIDLAAQVLEALGAVT